MTPDRINDMTYAVLKLVYDWCVAQFDANNNSLKETGESKVSMEYLEALAALAEALNKVMKYN
jgi:hypothetical protein